MTIEVFQSKSEAVAITDELIADFERDNPGIVVEQANVPDAMTVLQSRLAKGDVPDVIAINAGFLNDVATSGVLADLSGTPAEAAVTDQAALNTIQSLSGVEERIALPWASNAQVVLYNRTLFADAGVDVPTTWTEFIDGARALQAAGLDPFYFTWKDAWTAKVIFNSIGGSLQPEDFQQQLIDGTATFAESDAYRQTAEKLLQLKELAQDDAFGKGYGDGNSAFADGDAAMYIQGIWAIPEIVKTNPDLDLGAFVLPASDVADDTVIISGPDSFLGVAKDSDHVDAATKFVEYLLSKDAQAKFANDQFLFSVRDDVPNEDPLLAPLKSDWLDQGRVASYPDLMFTSVSDLAAIVQEFLQSGDVDRFLSAVDTDFASNGLR